jgi:hypothetical protein
MDWKFMQLMPPGARGNFDTKLYADPNWYAEEKLDGDRRIAQFCPPPEVEGDEGAFHDTAHVRFTGRKISEINGLLVEKTDRLPHLSGFQTVLAPDVQRAAPVDLIGTVLDGEIIVDKPGARSKDVTSIIGSPAADSMKGKKLHPGAITKQRERGWLVYVVFDIPFYKGEDLRKLPLVRRRRFLRQAIEEWGNPYVRIVPNSTLLGVKPERMVLDIWAREQPGEGIILKDLNSEYGDEKAWVKVKREFTSDVIITGYDDPEPVTEKIETYVDTDGIKRKRVLEVSKSRLAANGWIGAVRFGQYKEVAPGVVTNYFIDKAQQVPKYMHKDGKAYVLTDCGACSGMDDKLRAEISANKEGFLGRVVEILANEREDTGKFRHPRWVQFRDNKNASDCIWGQK